MRNKMIGIFIAALVYTSLVHAADNDQNQSSNSNQSSSSSDDVEQEDMD